jgi:hypothetical protein
LLVIIHADDLALEGHIDIFVQLTILAHDIERRSAILMDLPIEIFELFLQSSPSAKRTPHLSQRRCVAWQAHLGMHKRLKFTNPGEPLLWHKITHIERDDQLAH